MTPSLQSGSFGRRTWPRVRGSVLIVAMLLAAIIAISLGSYIKLAINSMNLADRSFYQNAAVNLAEVGVEEAIYCYNRLEDNKATPANAWTGWDIGTVEARSATRTIGGFDLGRGVLGEVKVYCSFYNPTLKEKPVVVAKATLTFPNSPPTSKYIEVTVRKRSLFPKGMIVRETIEAKGGNLSLDSWDSDPDDDPTTAMVVYPDGRSANAMLATQSTVNNAISIGNGVVYGYISTAGGSVGRQPQAVLTGNFSSTEFDTNRISNDFEVTAFAPTDPPTPGVFNSIGYNMGGETLPRGGDSAADGVYYYKFDMGRNISVNTGTLLISGKVVLLLTSHAGVEAMGLAGTGKMEIAAGASLTVYTNGNVKLSGGGGVSNANAQPKTCVIFGTLPTAASGQTIDLSGNGKTSVSLYAPNADITLSGGGTDGDFFGAIVGKSVTMTGTSRFHYDESLARLYVGKPYGLEKWRELQTALEREAYTAQLTF
jgi:hypothetical protein